MSTLRNFLVVSVLSLFARLWHRCRRVGLRRLPSRGPVLVLANHASHADPGFLMAAAGRRIEFLHAREYHNVAVVRWLFRLAGCIPISRGRSDVGALRAALQRLREGAAVGVFPEGEVSPAGVGQLGSGKTGAALLALRSEAQVIPAFIAGGTQGCGVAGDWLWPSSGVQVRFGPPVDLSAYRGRAITRRQLHEVTDLFMAQIAALETTPVINHSPVLNLAAELPSCTMALGR